VFPDWRREDEIQHSLDDFVDAADELHRLGVGPEVPFEAAEARVQKDYSYRLQSPQMQKVKGIVCARNKLLFV
jgi:hypothetical protein